MARRANNVAMQLVVGARTKSPGLIGRTYVKRIVAALAVEAPHLNDDENAQLVEGILYWRVDR